MGCFPSKCWPGRQADPSTQDITVRGVVLGELDKWKSSIEMLEKHGVKQAQIDKKSAASGKDAVASSTAAERAGLSQSYKQLKERLFGASQKPATAEGASGSPASSTDENDATSWRQKRSKILQTLSSGELMVSMAPAVVKSKLLDPPQEKERQQTVDALRVVEGAQDELHYISIVALAAKIFKVPYASIAIIDRQRIWMKAVHSNQAKVYELPREASFVSYMLLNSKREVMVVEDAKEDGRFHDFMITSKTRKKMRFLAAAPLYASNGYQIGALTITDVKPRKLDAGSFSLMTNLAEMVMRSLEKEVFGAEKAPDSLPPAAPATKIARISGRVGASELNTQLISDLADGQLQHVPSARKSPPEKLTLLRSMNMLETGIMVCNAASSGGVDVLYVNDIWTQLTGINAKAASSKSLWQIFSIPGQEASSLKHKLGESFARQSSLMLLGRLQGSKDSYFQLSFKSASADSIDKDMPLVGVPSFVEFSQKRDLCYFFVTVRKLPSSDDRKTGSKPPVSAFQAAADEEPWSDISDVTPDKTGTGPQTPERDNSIGTIQRRPSVSLPYNDDLFATVVLGPLLGRGSFGKVHRGVWNQEQIAVKILETFQQGEPGQEVDDLPEASLMEAMQHPNVMATYKHATRAKITASSSMRLHFGDKDPIGGYMLETWLLLEYCNKGSLQDAIDRGWFRTEPSQAKGKPDLSIILATGLELARGLEYLHSKGVLHGDLSPGNVLLHDAPEAAHGFSIKIADFGLSRAVASQTVKTQTFGTVTHMPPELLMDGKLTRAADVYAFGVLMWGMYTGVPPWQGMRRTQVLFKVTALGAVLQIPAGCPGFLKELLQKCMQRDHKERPTFQALVKELEFYVMAEKQGTNLQSFPSMIAQRQRRAVSMPKTTLSEVVETEPLGEAELRKTDSGSKQCRKAVSLQRRPSFSQQTHLEVV